MKPDNDVGGAVAEFIPFLDSRINKIIADEDDADEPKSRKNDPDRDDKDRT